MTCAVGCRHGSDPELLWLWRRLVATTLIRPLAWDSPYAAEAALEKAEKKRKKKKKKQKRKITRGRKGQGLIHVKLVWVC